MNFWTWDGWQAIEAGSTFLAVVIATAAAAIAYRTWRNEGERDQRELDRDERERERIEADRVRLERGQAEQIVIWKIIPNYDRLDRIEIYLRNNSDQPVFAAEVWGTGSEGISLSTVDRPEGWSLLAPNAVAPGETVTATIRAEKPLKEGQTSRQEWWTLYVTFLDARNRDWEFSPVSYN